MNHKPIPPRSGPPQPPLPFDQLLWRACLLYARARLELYHPRSVTRWN